MTSSDALGGLALGPAVVASAVAGACEAAGELSLYQGEDDLAAVARLCARAIRNSFIWVEVDDDTPPYCVEAEIPYFALRASHRIIVMALNQLESKKWNTGPMSSFPVANEFIDHYFTMSLTTIVDMIDMSGDWRSPNIAAITDPHDCDEFDEFNDGEDFTLEDIYGPIGIEVMEALDSINADIAGEDTSGYREAS
jgi:hypothetical protein